MRKIIFITFFFLLALTTLYYFATTLAFGKTPNGLAEFGDMFGGLNAVFSALALLGVVGGLIYQHKELTETKEELAKAAIAQQESAHALVAGAQAQKASSEALLIQLKTQQDQTEMQFLDLATQAEAKRITEAEKFDEPFRTTALKKARRLHKQYFERIRAIAEQHIQKENKTQ